MRLIDVDKAEAILLRASGDVVGESEYDEGLADGYASAAGMLDDMPTVEPKRGKWIPIHRHKGGFRRYTGLTDMGEQESFCEWLSKETMQIIKANLSWSIDKAQSVEGLEYKYETSKN